EGITQAVFPEGGLTRDGMLQQPKLGLFDYILRDFNPQSDRDVVFVPVAVNYDRVLEDRTLLLNLDPAREAKRGVWALVTAGEFVLRQLWLMARQKWHRFGYACVNFGTPISLSDYLEETSTTLTGLSKQDRFEQVRIFADHLMHQIAELIPVLPVALVSAVLLRQPERTFSELELKAEIQALMESLEMRGANLYLPRSDREYAIEVGIRMLVLRRMVENVDDLYRLNPQEHTLTRYYANSIAHLLSQEDSTSFMDRP
ncbi:MAG: hypothetical protein P8Y44_11270, partial [Acidobacteriota bacterium]